MTPTTTDPVAEFAALRPTDEDLDAAWPAARRREVLDRVLEGSAAPTGSTAAVTALPATSRRPSRRRALIAVTGIAAAVAALLAIPLVVPSGGPAGPPAAAALERLAATASAQPPLRPGEFWYTVVAETQNGHTTTLHRWAAPDGHVWRYDTTGDTFLYYNFPPGLLEDDIRIPSPGFLATLPTDPAALNTYLRAHVSGENSRDEAVFATVGSMLRGGWASPALRAAALRVLERTDHITARPGHDSTGRPAVVVTFIDQATRPGAVQRLYFAPDTARIIEESESWPGSTYTGTVTSSGVVTAIPARVRRLGTPTGTCITSQGRQPTRALCDAALTAGADQGLATPGK